MAEQLTNQTGLQDLPQGFKKFERPGGRPVNENGEILSELPQASFNLSHITDFDSINAAKPI